MKLQNLYPIIEYPVSNETPMLAPLVRWQHDASWRVVYASREEMIPGERRITIYPNGKEHSYILDHIIDGKNIMPGFGFVVSPIYSLVCSLRLNKRQVDPLHYYFQLKCIAFVYPTSAILSIFGRKKSEFPNSSPLKKVPSIFS